MTVKEQERREKLVKQLKVGDIIRVAGWDGDRTIKIVGFGEKDDRPLVDGDIVSSTDKNDKVGDTVWAYLDQIEF